MSFEVLQKRLRKEGWFVEWNMPCCQSCAWAEVEHDDLSRVLFNHTQDCQDEEAWEHEVECPMCFGHVNHEEDEEDCEECNGWGYIENDEGPPVMTPEQAGSSYFCFAGDKEGVKNLKAILPIIKECGCDYHWDETGKTRIEISWKI